MKKHIFTSLIVLILCGFNCCKFKNEPKEFTTRNWNPTLATPLADVNLTLQNVVKGQSVVPFIKEDGDGFITLIYQDTIFSEPIENYIVIPNQTFNREFKMPDSNIPTFDVVGSYRDSVKGTEAFNSGAADRSLDLIKFKGGSINLNVVSSYNQNVQVVIKLPHLKKNNQVLEESFTLPQNASAVRSISLEGYDLDLTRNGSNPKGLEYIIYFSITKIPGQTVPASAKINTSITINNPRYSYLEGYLGKFDIAIPNSLVQVDLFKNSIDADLFLEDPKLRLYFDNSVGASASVSVPALEVRFNNTAIPPRNITRNSGSFLDTTLSSPTLTQIGQSITTEVIYNKNNSNIRNSFNPSPYTVKYSATATINPSGLVSKNFVTDQSRLRLRADVELPLEGRINNLIIADTIKIKVGNDFQKDYNLEYITYKLNNENGFPFDCYLQGYFLDSNRVITDSIVIPKTRLLLPSANINTTTGRVTSSKTEYYFQKFEGDRIKNIQNARYIYLFGKFNTTNPFSNQNIKIYKDYFVKVRLAMEAKIKVEFEEKK